MSCRFEKCPDEVGRKELSLLQRRGKKGVVVWGDRRSRSGGREGVCAERRGW